jgi:6-pyruvoyl-tetrahydropterin synthase
MNKVQNGNADNNAKAKKRMATLYLTMLCVFITAMLTSVKVHANSNNHWQPVASETLLKLPANLIEKRIQQDFEMSPLANQLLSLESNIAGKGDKIKALQSLLIDASANEMTEERVSLLQIKSSYLDDMQLSQSLRQDALNKKQYLYEDVLRKLFHQQNSSANLDMQKLRAKQEEAKQRMDRVIAQVDATLLNDHLDKTSPYADEFAINLGKIEQLKKAISQHQSSLAPTIDGVEVSAQEYVRQLLMQAASDQSLLDQEALMISYMAKLVALDAQSIEFRLAYEETVDGVVINNFTKPNQAADLFF